MAKKQVSYYDQPTMAPEQALSTLRIQQQKLAEMCSRSKQEVGEEEATWTLLTESVVMRAFGKDSPQHSNLVRTRSAGGSSIMATGFGGYGASSAQLNADAQERFETRCQSRGATIKALILELEMLVPLPEIKGVYDAGDQFSFYGDLASILRSANITVFICDPYLSKEVFDTYLDIVPLTTQIHLLTSPGRMTQPGLLAVATMFKKQRPTFELRSNNALHDRIVIADQRCWVIGQSIKDAADKKPTYMVEVDKALFWPAYQTLWAGGTVEV